MLNIISALSLQVNRAIEICSEMHNIKDAIYENKRKMEAICEDYRIQVSILKKMFKHICNYVCKIYERCVW